MSRVNRISTNVEKSNRAIEKMPFQVTKEDRYYPILRRLLGNSLSVDIYDRYFMDYIEFINFRKLLGLNDKYISNKEIEVYKKVLDRRGINKRNIKTKITRILRYCYFIDEVSKITND